MKVSRRHGTVRLRCGKCVGIPYRAEHYRDPEAVGATAERWDCRATGRIREHKPRFGFLVLLAEVCCLDCGHRWWSRDEAAINVAMQVRRIRLRMRSET